MITTTEAGPELSTSRGREPRPGWRATTRAAFRFCVAYFGLYILTTQMLRALKLPLGNAVAFALTRLTNRVVLWTAAHVFHISDPRMIYSGSGDKTSDWVQAFCLLGIAIVSTFLWSWLDRRRLSYPGLAKWFRLFIRFSLAATMLGYGLGKAIPLQMPAPQLTRLLEPFGNFSPMGVLWYSIGASRPYEIFAGCAEVAGAILLFLPRTTPLGALICLVDAVEVFTLNMTYDVPVKLFAFHLILLSLVLLAPDARRLANLFLLNRSADPSTQPPLLRGRRANRIALTAQVAFGVYLFGIGLFADIQAWTQYGGGSPKSALYGIWNVDELAVNGQVRAPLVTDLDRWRRVVFDRPASVSFQRMDDTFVTYTASIDMSGKSLTLTRVGAGNSTSDFSFRQLAADQLILDGELDGRKIHMELRLFDRNRFLLVSRGFNWIQETPFNR